MHVFSKTLNWIKEINFKLINRINVPSYKVNFLFLFHQNSWFVEMRKNGTGPTTTGTTWTDTHKPVTINHYRSKQVRQFKWHTIVFTVVILMSLNAAQSTLSVTNRLARNVQKNGAHSDKVSYLFSLKA